MKPVVCALCGKVKSKKLSVLDEDGTQILVCEGHLVKDGKRCNRATELAVIRLWRRGLRG